MTKTQKKKYVVYKQKFLKDPTAPEWATPRVFVQKLDTNDKIESFDTKDKAEAKKKELEGESIGSDEKRKYIILEK